MRELTKKFIDVFVSTQRVFLFTAIIAVFPFISTVTGESLQFGGLALWKYLWLLWLSAVLIYIVRGNSFFLRWGGRAETLLWIFVTFMLVFSPRADLVIDPWKNWFFCFFVLFLFRLLLQVETNEIQAMAKSSLVLWWSYALILIVYAATNANYPGSIQHQFFLCGLLGLVAGLLLLVFRKTAMSEKIMESSLLLNFLAATFVNVVLNLTITEARSVFPFSLSLMLVAVAWLIKPVGNVAVFARRFGFPLVFLITLLPLLHLSGTMGNIVNEFTYPIFGKLRTIESKSGREAAFQIWSSYVAGNVRILGPMLKPMPIIGQAIDDWNKPLFGLSKAQLDKIKEKGMEAQKVFMARQQRLGVEIDVSHHDSALTRGPAEKVNNGVLPRGKKEESLAITSSHNQWLDAAARGGILYAVAIAWAFGYTTWLISARLALLLPATVILAYLAIAASWGFASQFDDEHWLYHIPYLTMFFIPVIASVLRIKTPVIVSNVQYERA
jgi:hypothetical protein